jgi:CheY-like chemotaxis protein
VLQVRDTGLGIPAADRVRIFDMFTQLETSPTRPPQGGLGLGLAIVRQIVGMHGGSVSADSAGPGQGSTFTVRLPLAVPPVAALPSEREAGPTAGFRKRRVLVVDDSQDAADTLATMIELAGHSATVAYDGFEALARAGDAPPDIAFCDIGMPGMDGYELAARLRAQPGLEALKLVAVTGWGSPQDERRARQAGFDLHLPKPASAAAIVAAIEG